MEREAGGGGDTGPGGWSGRSREVVRTGGRVRLFRERTSDKLCWGPIENFPREPLQGEICVFYPESRCWGLEGSRHIWHLPRTKQDQGFT